MDILEEAKSLKNNAKATKEIADTKNDPESYDEALEDLKEARGLLMAELSAIERKPSSITELLNKRRQEIALELADCFGITGGIYRRKGDIGEAIKMYEKGYEYEKNPDYNIQDSYNMTNRIVLRILNEPHLVEQLMPKIEEALSIIQKQVEGPRRRQWWARADLGLLYILTKDEKRGLDAYREFKDYGALPKHYDSSIAVLIELKGRLEKVDQTIYSSIEKAINFLKEEKSAIEKQTKLS